MRKIDKYSNHIRTFSLFLALAVMLPVGAWAQTSSSSNYQVQEAQFGSGGAAEVCSGNEYCAQGSLGANAVGGQSSANFDAEAGVLTDNEEFLEFVILNTNVNLGVLSTTTTGTGTAEFYVRTYLSSGYAVYSVAPSPSIAAGESLDPMTTTAASQQGTEQFGINLVDNTNPNIGANLANQPDGTFADGAISTGYDVVDQFRYVDGESIVEAPATVGNQGTGQTNYTISYIANVSALTPAGTYVMNHNLIAVPTY